MCPKAVLSDRGRIRDSLSDGDWILLKQCGQTETEEVEECESLKALESLESLMDVSVELSMLGERAVDAAVESVVNITVIGIMNPLNGDVGDAVFKDSLMVQVALLGGSLMRLSCTRYCI